MDEQRAMIIAQLQAEERERLKIKVGYLATGAVIGVLLAPPGVANKLAGFMIGESIAWIAHGITQGRWFV